MKILYRKSTILAKNRKENHLFKPGSCTSELQLKVNCKIKFGLAQAKSCQTGPNFILQFTFGLQFSFSCNSLLHDPDLGTPLLKCSNYQQVVGDLCPIKSARQE